VTPTDRVTVARWKGDGALLWSAGALAALAAGVVALILAFLVRDAWPALSSVGLGRFFGDPSWHPAGGPWEGSFNLTPMLAGTLAASFGALLLATPAGIFAALFCRYYAPPPVGRLFRRLLELLAGIPSVVYGFWGLVTLAPLIRRWQPPGQSLLTGVLILALMILPTVALLTEASLRAVPSRYLRGAAALGLGRWATLSGVVLPAARGGIAVAVLLATGRAVGETMALLMVTGNVVQVPSSVFDPVRTLTANIALELGYALDHHRSALFVSGLVLMAMVVVLVLVAEWLARGRRHD
jgi:phosphate transport system permease protein